MGNLDNFRYIYNEKLIFNFLKFHVSLCLLSTSCLKYIMFFYISSFGRRGWGFKSRSWSKILWKGGWMFIDTQVRLDIYTVTTRDDSLNTWIDLVLEDLPYERTHKTFTIIQDVWYEIKIRKKWITQDRY